MRAVDLFAGAGGWTLGCEQAGVRVVAAINHWPRAVETHRLNHPDMKHVCQDAQTVDYRDIPRHDLLCASPACQGHSNARGKERPHHDATRDTALCVVTAVEVCRPRFLLVENVVEMRRWTLYPHWLGMLRALGYRLAEHVLNAADFGAPQGELCT